MTRYKYINDFFNFSSTDLVQVYYIKSVISTSFLLRHLLSLASICLHKSLNQLASTSEDEKKTFKERRGEIGE